jgi:hypothetical protein
LWPEHAERVLQSCGRRPAAALIDHVIDRRRELVDDTAVIVATRRLGPTHQAHMPPALTDWRQHDIAPLRAAEGILK